MAIINALYSTKSHKIISSVNILSKTTNYIKFGSQIRCINHIQHTAHRDENANSNSWKLKSLLALTIGSGVALYIHGNKKTVIMKEKITIEKTSPSKFYDHLPTYGYEEVGKHNTFETRIWVTYKNGVYDITDFIKKHPGGNQILEAAGTSIDPFWDLYQQHDTPQIEKMLEKFRIGNYEHGREVDDISNIWSNQPKRDPRLIIRSERPFNAETPKKLLRDSFITPSNLFYVRHHLPVPEFDEQSYKLSISSNDNSTKTLSLTLDDIKKYPKYSVTASLMCAGNRRSDMNKFKQTRGLEWGPGAVGTAVWSGTRLKDILEAANIKNDDNKHVQFFGMDLDATGKAYGASIPLSKALDEKADVILAYEMNHHPIPRDHGYPLRVFVPGTVGARCVKWLDKIVISEEESLSHWQRQDYKGFNPSIEPTAEDYNKSTSIQHLPVMSAIISPSNGDTVSAKNEFIEVKGYAWSGGGQKIIRIDLTGDHGKTWIDGAITEQDKMPAGRHWCWTFWTAKIPIKKGQKEVEIWVKAVDSNYNTQPDNVGYIWNLRGVINNSMDKIKLNIK